MVRGMTSLAITWWKNALLFSYFPFHNLPCYYLSPWETVFTWGLGRYIVKQQTRSLLHTHTHTGILSAHRTSTYACNASPLQRGDGGSTAHSCPWAQRIYLKNTILCFNLISSHCQFSPRFPQNRHTPLGPAGFNGNPFLHVSFRQTPTKPITFGVGGRGKGRHALGTQAYCLAGHNLCASNSCENENVINIWKNVVLVCHSNSGISFKIYFIRADCRQH